MQGWSRLAALLALWVPGAAQAQIFTPTINPFRPSPFGIPPSARMRAGRFQGGAYLALWEFAPVAAPGIRFESLAADASALLTGEYFVNRNVSVGGWWNPFSGELKGRDVAGGSTFKIADIRARFWDAHVIYYLPGKQTSFWSVQAGFSRIHYRVDVIPGLREVGLPNFSQSFSSPEIWVHRTQEIGARRLRGRRRPIRLFGSVGYYTSSQLDRAWNFLVGGSFPLTSRLDLSSSVWINDPGSNMNTRVTVGLAGSF